VNGRRSASRRLAQRLGQTLELGAVLAVARGLLERSCKDVCKTVSEIPQSTGTALPMAGVPG